MPENPTLRDEDITTTWLKAGSNTSSLQADPDNVDPDATDADGTDGDTGDSDSQDS